MFAEEVSYRKNLQKKFPAPGVEHLALIVSWVLIPITSSNKQTKNIFILQRLFSSLSFHLTIQQNIFHVSICGYKLHSCNGSIVVHCTMCCNAFTQNPLTDTSHWSSYVVLSPIPLGADPSATLTISSHSLHLAYHRLWSPQSLPPRMLLPVHLVTVTCLLALSLSVTPSGTPSWSLN